MFRLMPGGARVAFAHPEGGRRADLLIRAPLDRLAARPSAGTRALGHNDTPDAQTGPFS